MGMFKKNLKFFSAVAVIAVVACAVVAWYALGRKPEQGKKLIQPNELKRVTFSTNGKITSQWVANTLAIKKGADLFAMDIASMRARLESLSQVRKVFIEKLYPDTLSIRLEERSPILKIAVKADGKKSVFLVDGTDGNIFSPICYDDMDLDRILPANMSLKPAGGKVFRFLPLKGASTVGEFISTLRKDFPEIFKITKFIDLKNYDSRPGAVWATMELHLKNGIVVVFGTRQLDLQLLRLDYMLNEKCAGILHKIKKINVSSSNDGVLEYK